MAKGGDAILADMAKVVAVRAMAITQADNWHEIQDVILDLAPTLERAGGFLEASAALANPKQQRGAKAGKDIGLIERFRQKAIDDQMAEVNGTMLAAAKVAEVMVAGSHESPEFYSLVQTEVTRRDA